MTNKYLEYLKSKDWLNKKTNFYNSKYDKFCYVCHRDKIPLQVHHKTYKRLYNERLSDLIYLCDRCHPLVHKFQKITKEPLVDSARKFKQLLGLRKRSVRESPFYSSIALRIINEWFPDREAVRPL